MNIKLDIPESFFKGEERCGYYVSPEMKKVWAVELDLLAEFSRVCEKHGIKWWMDAGTLLGAVRHKGFIPWDDDVDVIMMREDYERLSDIAPEEFQYPYFLVNPRLEEPGRFHQISKLQNISTTMLESDSFRRLKKDMRPAFRQGIFIDVFPLDDVPDDDDDAEKLFASIRSIRRKADRLITWKYDYYPSKVAWRRPIKAFIHYICEKFDISCHRYFVKMAKVLQANRHPDSKKISQIISAVDPLFKTRRIWDRSCFSGTVYLPFEMLTLPAPSGYIDILDHFYGNWHEYFIRGTHGKFYDTERPYTYYTSGGTPNP